jgi:uncharacterized protein YbjQ (UPF0145 family)
MIEEAQSKGANAVVDMRFETAMVMQNAPRLSLMEPAWLWNRREKRLEF